MKQSGGARLNERWVLLDNQSKVDVFSNKLLLRNIRKVQKWMGIYCNAGVASTNMMGELPGYGLVWYHKEGIANILSLSKVIMKSRERFDSHKGNMFKVFREDGSYLAFI